MSVDNQDLSDDSGLKNRRIHLREISGDSENPLDTVGQDLRAARLRRGDEIALVSRALKIRKDYLEALEQDRLEDLPGKTYAIGFVRSYARHLGLDSHAYVERFKRDIAGRSEDAARGPAPIHQEESRRLPQGWGIIAGVVGLLLLYGGYHLLSSGGAGDQAVPPAPVIAITKPAPKPAPAPMPAAAPAQTATVPSDTDSTAAVSPAAESQVPAAQASAPDTGVVYGKANADPHVILHARADVRVTVTGGGGQLYLNRDLKAGDVYRVPNLPGLFMATSNAGGLDVELDNKLVGRMGQDSQVLGKVSLDPASLADRFHTH